MKINSQIDPFLYRSDPRLRYWNNYFKNKKSLDFKSLLEQNLDHEVSSDQLSRIPTRDEVLTHANGDKNRLKVYEAAKEFESFFVEKMFKEMKKNVPKNPLFYGGFAEEVFDEMLLTERVRSLAENTHFGLAEMIYGQLQNSS